MEDDFEEFWMQYGKRPGGNPKKAARRAYAARVKDGVSPADLLHGAMRYRAYFDAKPPEQQKFKKQAQFWLSPSYEGWLQDWTVTDDSVVGQNVGALRDAILNIEED